MAVRRKGRLAVRVLAKRRWQAVVEAWERSGEEMTRFAARHGLPRQRISRFGEKVGGRPGEGVRFHPVRMGSAGTVLPRNSVSRARYARVRCRRRRRDGAWLSGWEERRTAPAGPGEWVAGRLRSGEGCRGWC